MNPLHFFAGGNTAQGFFPCFEDILPEDRRKRVFYLKGGPGVGKSTLMRRVAAHAEAHALVDVPEPRLDGRLDPPAAPRAVQVAGDEVEQAHRAPRDFSVAVPPAGRRRVTRPKPMLSTSRASKSASHAA